MSGRSHEIPQDIISHLGSQNFSLDVLELYAATPETFTPTREARTRWIQVDWVKDTNRDGYLTVSAQPLREVSEEFAEQKLPMTLKKFTSAGFHPIVAVVDGQAAGSIDLYLTDDTIEIDTSMSFLHSVEKVSGRRFRNLSWLMRMAGPSYWWLMHPIRLGKCITVKTIPICLSAMNY